MSAVIGDPAGHCASVGGHAVQVRVAVPVGEEVDPVLVPHRKGVHPLVIGDLPEISSREVTDIDVLRPPALVLLPMVPLEGESVERDLFTVGREAREGRLGEREPFGSPPSGETLYNLQSY